MNVKILIDCIVRNTTVLIAQLATSGGVRAPLAHVAHQVFWELSRELEAQGVSRKVSADMFGMALRTYQRRIQWLSESFTDRGRTLWEALLDHLSEGELVSRQSILRRFARDDEAVVKGVLYDLVESGLLLCSGSGPQQSYRATTRAERLQMSESVEGSTSCFGLTSTARGRLLHTTCSSLAHHSRARSSKRCSGSSPRAALH